MPRASLHVRPSCTNCWQPAERTPLATERASRRGLTINESSAWLMVRRRLFGGTLVSWEAWVEEHKCLPESVAQQGWHLTAKRCFDTRTALDEVQQALRTLMQLWPPSTAEQAAQECMATLSKQ